MIPSLSMVLRDARDVPAADAALQTVTRRYEILLCNSSATCERLAQRFQWLRAIENPRKALLSATGDLIAVADRGADFSELGWLVPWAGQSLFVFNSNRKQGLLRLFTGSHSDMAIVHHSEIQRLLTTSRSCDPASLAVAAEKLNLSVAAPRRALAA